MKKAPGKPRREYRQLQEIIFGLTDGVILIGTDRRIIWANEAALTMHGVRKIGELGTTVGQYRKRFRLSEREQNRMLGRGAYPIERVVAAETFSEVTVEVRPAADPEQWWAHSVRGLVITDEAGAPEYFVLVIKDESARFRAEDRFESAFNANPAPALICRVSDLRYIRVNPGFVEMTGYSREQVLEASFPQIDVLTGAGLRELALERLKDGRTIPQMESLVVLPDGGSRHVIVAGEPLEVDEGACILFTFADLDARVKAETALRQSEERFAKSFRLSPVPMVICTLADFAIVEANEAFKAITSYATEEVIGRDPTELRLWADPAAQRHLELAIREDGGVRRGDLQLRAKDEALFDCLVSTDTVTINDVRCVLFVIQDITERKRSEAELITAIEAVMADASWFSRSIVEKLAALRRSSKPPIGGSELDGLTERECEVLGMICQGASNRQISEALELSPHTVRNHIASIYHKIGVNRRAAVIVWARERGITGRDGLLPRRRKHA